MNLHLEPRPLEIDHRYLRLELYLDEALALELYPIPYTLDLELRRYGTLPRTSNSPYELK